MSYQTIVPTLDGPQPSALYKNDGCCPPSLCNIDYCGFICSFLQYLPRGPIWDYWRRLKYHEIISTKGVCGLNSCDNNPCVTIIDHAIYVAKKLLYILQNPLQTAIWEADPLKAFNTRDYWLSVYGYEDCFEGPGGNPVLGFPTPYQAVCNALLPFAPCDPATLNYQMTATINGNQNPVIDISQLVKDACPADLLLAVKYAIVKSCTLLQPGIIPTLASMNFVLAPLGVSVTSQVTGFDQQSCLMLFDCNQMTGEKECYPNIPEITFTLHTLNSGKIASGPGITVPLTCETSRSFGNELITASYEFPGIVMPTTVDCPDGTIAGNGTIYPAMMAAECILLNMLPPNIVPTVIRSP